VAIKRQREVYEWVRKIQSMADKCVNDARSGRPSTLTCAQFKDRLDQCIRENYGNNVDEADLR
jgi:hypothetical protein